MYFSPYRHYPQASAVTRNPSALRGWPEYLQGQTLPDVKRVAIIGNSQSTTWELEQDEIYVAFLRKRFLDAGLSVAIENWSVDGLRSDQIELLMAQAIARSMDLVVISVSLSNINISREFRFDRHAADLDLLVANPEVWPWLDKTHSLAEISLEQKFWRRLQLLSALARSRTSIHDQFALWIPVKYHRDVFGRWLPRTGIHTHIARMPFCFNVC